LANIKNTNTNTIWIKFEGPQNENGFANLHKVKNGNKTWYILNYTKTKRPSSVSDGDEFFLAEGITDSRGKNIQVITGRGHLYGFNDNNISFESWIKEYNWMEYRPWYVIIKDFERIDTPIKNCLSLDKVLLNCRSDTYESSFGQNCSFEEIKRKHTQKIHMKLTSVSSEFINKELDKLAKKYGSTVFESEL
jgi:hypothetical protein